MDSLFSSFGGDRQSGSFVIQGNRDKLSTRKFEVEFSHSRDRANYEATIADLIAGQHSDPLRVVTFNTVADRAEDVSHAIARKILRRLGLEGRSVPPVLEDFIDRHAGRDRQLTLRMALT